MYKLIKCKECNNLHYKEKICDTCGKSCDVYIVGQDTPIALIINFTTYHFDKYECLLQFIIAEIKKQKPKEDRFIYGEEK